jgi:hypothetical protein
VNTVNDPNREAAITVIKGGAYFIQYQIIISVGIGPSGVRALPLAAGRSEGGHYF